MLLKLSIDNYAIIDHLELEPAGGLTMITGETGAGKSILTGALGLVLGFRADTSVLVKKESKCVVEATFDIRSKPGIINWLLENDHDEQQEIVIRREISPAGKSRAFVNDTP